MTYNLLPQKPKYSGWYVTFGTECDKELFYTTQNIR